MLSHYVPLHQFRELKESLAEYTKNDEFSIVQENIMQLRNIASQKAEKDDLFKKEREIVTSIEEKLEHYVQTSAYNTQINVIKNDMKSVISRISTASEDLDTIKSYSEIIEKKLNAKVDSDEYKAEMTQIWGEFQNYASFDHIKELANKLGTLNL